MNLDNWTYDGTADSYTHPEGWVYQFDHVKHNHTTTGFKQEIRVYKAEQPESAPQNERTLSALKSKRKSNAFI